MLNGPLMEPVINGVTVRCATADAAVANKGYCTGEGIAGSSTYRTIRFLYRAKAGHINVIVTVNKLVTPPTTKVVPLEPKYKIGTRKDMNCSSADGITDSLPCRCRCRPSGRARPGDKCRRNKYCDCDIWS